MRILLTTETRNIPLSLTGASRDPDLGTVVMFATFKNEGIMLSSFILLNIFNKDAFRSFPITPSLNISFANPSESLDFPFFKSDKASSNSFIVHILQQLCLIIIGYINSECNFYHTHQINVSQ